LRLADHRAAPARADDSGVSSVALRAPSDALESSFYVFSPSEHSLYEMFPVHCPMNFRAGGQPAARQAADYQRQSVGQRHKPKRAVRTETESVIPCSPGSGSSYVRDLESGI